MVRLVSIAGEAKGPTQFGKTNRKDTARSERSIQNKNCPVESPGFINGGYQKQIITENTY